jgi:hypothetical protein
MDIDWKNAIKASAAVSQQTSSQQERASQGSVAKSSRIPTQTIAFVQAAFATAAVTKLDPRDRRFLARVVTNPNLSLQRLAPFAGIRTRQGAHRIWKTSLHALWLASPAELQDRYPLAELLRRKRGTFRPHSPQTRAKLRAAQLGRKISPETRERYRQAQMGKRHSAEAKARMRESQLKRWSTINFCYQTNTIYKANRQDSHFLTSYAEKD